jgi:multimeric flavodoxin WrbA
LETPVYFNNVSAQLKAFMDRTWCIKGKLRNKFGGTVVVGRNDGAEGAITAIHAFFLKHDMLPAKRGVRGYIYEKQEIEEDPEVMESAKKLSRRMLELGKVLRIPPYKVFGFISRAEVWSASVFRFLLYTEEE